ncbi:MAG: iron-sulfur cluster assembly scaffold protein [Dehalococcoidales bacterium]|jgi:nitrogen fixation NifU-like protein|nr:iron-sulfur cluster assembly scaffold protein [Dehalococcoidales bacterium]MDX9985899.1 iron-sulfur cluster assembly scaffold protein [Dehalococcoidales bacterium]NLE90907.1 iron-sulfur cluster assembly scaffold protein [Dehalococcoidales bacterium]
MSDGALDKLRDAIQAELRYAGFSEKALLHATRPANTGELAGHNAFGISFGENGETLAIWLKVKDEVITGASFTSDGDDALTACGSMITELIKGKTLEQAGLLTSGDLVRALGGLPQGCSVAADLTIEVLGNALLDAPGS